MASNNPLQSYLKSSCEEEDEFDWIAAAQHVTQTQTILCHELAASEQDEKPSPLPGFDHRKLPRRQRRVFNTAQAKRRIGAHFTGPAPLFDERHFSGKFRISIACFQRLKEDFEASGIPYYQPSRLSSSPSLEAKLLLPLKALANGGSLDQFSEYFEMSYEAGRQCCFQFDNAMRIIYAGEYLRRPTSDDIASEAKLHKRVHDIDGMFASLDCSHSIWKNCPKAWQGSYKGKAKKCTIVLEAACDYNLWFWHASFGYPGTVNDKSILQSSSLLDSFLDGTFDQLEKEAGAVPYTIAGEEFHKLFVLVDGIYPPFSRFVLGISQPSNEEEKQYTKWQEGARKDIERAFGVMLFFGANVVEVVSLAR